MGAIKNKIIEIVEQIVNNEKYHNEMEMIDNLSIKRLGEMAKETLSDFDLYFYIVNLDIMIPMFEDYFAVNIDNTNDCRLD